MRYFSSFPDVYITDPAGHTTVAKNIMARVNIIPDLIKNPLISYDYTLQDGDTPEIISSKYYNTPYRYWIFLFGNQTIDPQWDIGLSYNNFIKYIKDKYKTVAEENNLEPLEYAQTTVKFYYRTVTTTDSVTNTTTVKKIIVDYETYLQQPTHETKINYFPDGSHITTILSRETLSIYDYEDELNTKKRNVVVVNNSFTSQIEETTKSLLRR